MEEEQVKDVERMTKICVGKQRARGGLCRLLADCQYKVFCTANSIIHTSQRLEESGKAGELQTIEEQN